MKVAVTGHTSGIGQGLYRYFADQGHIVTGFSRSNGYSLPELAVNVVVKSLDCDVFVNNALPVQGQIDLLRLLWPKWQHTKKTIIVVSSIATDLPYAMTGQEQYQRQKRELDDLCNEYRYSADAQCRIISIHPGYVATNIFKELDLETPLAEHCMSVDEVVNVVDYILKSPVCIHDITFVKK
jgi:NAD(P)-dependent dehydrogenase (short-subunit alcohol dehydrogenase family)